MLVDHKIQYFRLFVQVELSNFRSLDCSEERVKQTKCMWRALWLYVLCLYKYLYTYLYLQRLLKKKKNMKSKTNFVKNKRINMSWSCEKWKLPCRVKQRWQSIVAVCNELVIEITGYSSTTRWSLRRTLTREYHRSDKEQWYITLPR